LCLHRLTGGQAGKAGGRHLVLCVRFAEAARRTDDYSGTLSPHGGRPKWSASSNAQTNRRAGLEIPLLPLGACICFGVPWGGRIRRCCWEPTVGESETSRAGVFCSPRS